MTSSKGPSVIRNLVKAKRGFTSSGEKSTKGFTLIELLIVIAIIAILVVIVIIAINPIQRLADAADRQAASNVRSAGTLMATCVTVTVNKYNLCESTYLVNLNGNGTLPSNVNVTFAPPIGNPPEICVDQQGNTGTGGTTAHWYIYRQKTGSVETRNVTTQPVCGP